MKITYLNNSWFNDNKDNLKVTELVEIQLLNRFELKLQTVGSAREKNI